MPPRLRVALLAAFLISVPLSFPRTTEAQDGCTFTLGFKALRDLIPSVVGECLENEHFEDATGNALQATSGGLLVWRKADNWTAFTNGVTTWLNGPNGLVSRLNDGPKFAWETTQAAPAQGGPSQGGGSGLRQVALQLGDLQPTGFTLRKMETKPIGDPGNPVGESLECLYARFGGGASSFAGPLEVSQVIRRLDRQLTAADDLLEFAKRYAAEQRLEKANDGPNDKQRLTFVRREGATALYVYGFVKKNYVVFTGVAGLTPPVDAAMAVALGDKSGARIDALGGS
jgi:hypothetical protein